MAKDNDKKFMKIAFNEAIKGFKQGNFPIGAVLVINRKLIGKAHNKNKSNSDWNSHAESSLIKTYSKLIKRHKMKKAKIEIYSTLEPCLMCLGACVLNKLDRIVYACPDPVCGATKLDIGSLPSVYQSIWPIIEQESSFAKKSCELLCKYMDENENWKEALGYFKELKIHA